MKKWMISFSILLGSTLTSCSQGTRLKDVPSVVKNTFEAKFVNASDVDWEKMGSAYEVEFEIKKADHKALIDATGNIKMHKQKISSGQLPGAIKNAISAKYANYRIDEAGLLQIGGVTYYQVELNGKPIDAKIVFSADGQENETVSYWE